MIYDAACQISSVDEDSELFVDAEAHDIALFSLR